MRDRLKHVFEAVMVRSGLSRARQALGGDRVIILAYHNIIPTGAAALGDRSLHLSFDAFRDQLDILQHGFLVVPLDEILRGGVGSKPPPVAITFDDGYRGCLHLAIPELVSRGLPCTIFLPPGLLGSSGFWWDLLADEGLGAVPPDIRNLALGTLGGDQTSILRWAREEGLLSPSLPEYYRPASEAEILQLSGEQGVTLGSHTWSHINLVSAAAEMVPGELNAPLAWLAEVGSMCRALSYPYGLWAPGLEPLLASAGYEAGLLVEGGAAKLRSLGTDRFAIPRLNVPAGISRNGFLLRLSGLRR